MLCLVETSLPLPETRDETAAVQAPVVRRNCLPESHIFFFAATKRCVWFIECLDYGS
jgi:hypothetical protein